MFFGKTKQDLEDQVEEVTTNQPEQVKTTQDETVQDETVQDETVQDELDFDLEESDTTVYQEDPLPEESTAESEEQPQVQSGAEIKSKEPAKEENQIQNIILYMIMDKSTPDMIDYFRSYGLNVAQIFCNIDDAKNEIMMQIEPCRIVIVDSGTGRFSVMGARKSLIDLIGLGDEDNKISVFYTDTVIKEDLSLSEQVDNKQVDWVKYRSTVDILATLLQKKKKENYVLDSTVKTETKLVKPEDLMRYKGLAYTFEEMDLGQPSITPYDIQLNLDSNDNRTKQLEAFEVKY